MTTTVPNSQALAPLISGATRMNRQRGVVLIVALVVLVGMMLASIAMVRSVDTAALIAGNLAFKHSATAGADAGVEAAIAWLSSNASSLEDNSESNGYYATSGKCSDLTGNGAYDKKKCTSATALDWTDATKVKTLLDKPAGNTVAYVIHRMCDNRGPLNGKDCAVEQSYKDGNSKGIARQMGTYQEGSWPAVANRGFYRITARAAGPRNTASYVQAIVSM